MNMAPLQACLLFLLAVAHPGAAVEGEEQCPKEAAELAKQIELTPACPDWSSLFPKPAELDRRLRIACPCVGIHGCGHALQSMATGADSVLVYDLQAGYKNYLLDHLQAGACASRTSC